ncbi:MAG: phosphate ABC transporter permease PstA [Methanosarcina thermophila]|jgi:phosphate transport system permease protein|uniref:Phosphate transport system permease protein PstA n=3 Tax=Methanosarcina thermophila TaxID=2210 RepID=A0A1I7AR35_METTE|nr:phosphate ABC transporter permease PstA [Methanosarcina thermophila]AKB13002.1 Phosphate transport system permease protein PstA [Methanosarcina thermophila TM-1]AKB16367.1 Phosphate transport system permease protein PstA [Methanosarcina thermophila CHTI-55]SFT77375.1 phosphate ABC transporter membrane protein 2, PhoT family [Methanosarcina thermophila]BAW27985.1 phosphate transport system permease protein PstA [Methanosarcina thermophila]GLI14441.1 phosphate ABC transporter, permease protei
MGLNSNTNEKIAFSLLTLATIIVTGIVLVILAYIILNGYGAISIEFLTQMPNRMMTAGGIFPAIIGTIALIIGSMLVALPLGVMAAIYLNEYAGESRTTWLIEMAINNLAGTPSVVFGLFGLALFVKYFDFGPSILSASLTLALLILPVIIRASEEALLTVPNEYRESSLALGVSKWQTIRYVVLPAAIPGIVTGSVLSIGRVAGETAPILFTGAAYFLPRLPDSIYSQFMALPYHLFVLATAGTNISETKSIQYGTALVLLIIVLGVNLVAVVIRRHYRNKLKI